jgi:uncharacterized protein (TIGR02145 family)
VFVCSEQNKLQIARRNPLSMRPVCFLSPLLSLIWLATPSQAQYVSSWDPDADGDNVIGINDLLALLGVFEEVDTDNDGIFDSLDACVGMYDPCGVCNGTGSDDDTDGVCDEADPCVGILDECGLCNGPGPSVPVIDQVVYVTDSVFLQPLGTWYVFSYATDTLFTFVCPVQGCTDTAAENFNPQAVIEDGSCAYGPPQCGGQSTVTFDGHTYALVGIGTQCWFKENLRSDNYRSGDEIPGNLSNPLWQNTISGAQAVYYNNAANLVPYGRLYNWYAVIDSRGLCPTDFHVPSDADWMMLEMALGMTQEQANNWEWRGTNQGTQMKSSPINAPSWNGSNSSGFSGLPGGFRSNSGYFNLQGSFGYWWSATLLGSGAIGRDLSTASLSVSRYYWDSPQFGFSVRCVRD